MNGTFEQLLGRAKGGDRDAAQQLLLENNGLVWSVVRRFYGRGVDPDDLYQLGCLGFLKALEGFDPAFGTQFSTYAVPKISGEIRRFLRDDGAVKVSRAMKEQAAAIKMARQQPDGTALPGANPLRAGGKNRPFPRGDRRGRDGHQRHRVHSEADGGGRLLFGGRLDQGGPGGGDDRAHRPAGGHRGTWHSGSGWSLSCAISGP